MTESEFENITHKYYRAVVTVIRRMIWSPCEVEDLAQDVFLRLWKKNLLQTDENKIFTLIYRIAVNICIDHLRRHRTGARQMTTEPVPATDYSIEKNEFYETVKICLKHLKTKQRLVFILRDLEGLTFSEISEILKMPLNNIRSNLYLARKKIRLLLENEFNFREEDFYEL